LEKTGWITSSFRQMLLQDFLNFSMSGFLQGDNSSMMKPIGPEARDTLFLIKKPHRPSGRMIIRKLLEKHYTIVIVKKILGK
jgi:hypothetical protein